MRIKKLREDFFYLRGSDTTLKLYDPYIRMSVIPAKKTFSGEHDKKICISIGRAYNEQKATSFLTTESPLKEKIADRLSKETGLTLGEVLKRAKDGTLKNLLIDIWGKSAKKLGIPVIILQKKRGFEIYEMLKTSDIGEIAQVIYGSLIALGKAVKLFSSTPEEELIYWKIHIKKNVDKFINSGFSG